MEKRREEVIFETMREAEVWADGVANEMHGRVFDGYETLDYKIAYALSFFLAQEREFTVCTEKQVVQISLKDLLKDSSIKNSASSFMKGMLALFIFSCFKNYLMLSP